MSLFGCKCNKEAEIREHRKTVENLEKQIKELRVDREVEERKLQHLLKMKEEKDSITQQKIQVAMRKDFLEKESSLRQKHHDDLISALQSHKREMDGFFAQVLTRLPNVNMEIRKRA